MSEVLVLVLVLDSEFFKVLVLVLVQVLVTEVLVNITDVNVTDFICVLSLQQRYATNLDWIIMLLDIPYNTEYVIQWICRN